MINSCNHASVSLRFGQLLGVVTVSTRLSTKTPHVIATPLRRKRKMRKRKRMKYNGQKEEAKEKARQGRPEVAREVKKR